MLNRQTLSMALVAAGGFAAIAFAQRLEDRITLPDAALTEGAARLGFSELARRIEAQGMQIWEMEEEDGRIEVKATDRDGRRVTLWLDPRTGAELRRPDRGR